MLLGLLISALLLLLATPIVHLLRLRQDDRRRNQLIGGYE